MWHTTIIPSDSMSVALQFPRRGTKSPRLQANPRVEKSTLMSDIKQSLLVVVPGGLLPLLFIVSSSIVEARTATE